MSTDNLIPNSERTPKERQELARKAGIASGKARLRKKHGKELVRAILEMRETDPRIIEEMVRLGLNKTDLTNEVVMNVRQIEKAKRKADTKAYTAIQKAAGYVDEDVNIDINIDNQPPVIVFSSGQPAKEE